MSKILLVDDANLVLQIETALFRRTGVQIVTASTGSEALRLILTEKPDLVLLDLMLPDITGDRICEQVKRNPQTANIPIIIVTTRGRPEDIERCRKAGCDDFATKPIHSFDLVRKAMQLIRLPHRRCTRKLVRIETELSSGDRVFYGISVDLSPNGMLLESSHIFKSDEILQLRFLLPDGQEFRARARVARDEPSSAGKSRAGIEFLDLDSTQLESLQKFVEAASA